MNITTIINSLRLVDNNTRDESFCAANENAELTKSLEELNINIIGGIANKKQKAAFIKEVSTWKRRTHRFCLNETKEFEGGGSNSYWVLSNYGCLNTQAKLRINSLRAKYGK